MVWYGGGKLAADLTLPRLRRRWAAAGADPSAFPGPGSSPVMARTLLRDMVSSAAGQARGEAEFFGRLRADGVLVRLRFSDLHPDQVTGYSVGLPGDNASAGAQRWYGGGRLAAGLTLPRRRRRWDQPPGGAAERPGTFRFTAPAREAIFEHAARQAAAATEHIRHCVRHDPDGAADAAWAAADTLHVAARALRSRELRRAADSYDRAAFARYGAVPARTRQGDQLRRAARLMAMTGALAGDTALITTALAASLMTLAVAVAELREAQQHAGQAAAARAAAGNLHAARSRRQVPQAAREHPRTSQGHAARPARHAFSDFREPAQPDPPPRATTPSSGPAARHGSLSPRRARPGR